MIQSGRRVNDSMGFYVANRVARSIMRSAGNGRPVVTVLGVTFKENVPDIRNTRVVDIVRELEDFGIAVQLHDPMADGDLLKQEYGLSLTPLDRLQPADAVVLSVAHRELSRRRLGPGEVAAEARGRLRGRHSRRCSTGRRRRPA